MSKSGSGFSRRLSSEVDLGARLAVDEDDVVAAVGVDDLRVLGIGARGRGPFGVLDALSRRASSS